MSLVQLVPCPNCPLSKLSLVQIVPCPTCPLSNLSIDQLVPCPTCPLSNLSLVQLDPCPTCPLSNLSLDQLVPLFAIINVADRNQRFVLNSGYKCVYRSKFFPADTTDIKLSCVSNNSFHTSCLYPKQTPSFPSLYIIKQFSVEALTSGHNSPGPCRSSVRCVVTGTTTDR
jgi:hypothetical protein